MQGSSRNLVAAVLIACGLSLAVADGLAAQQEMKTFPMPPKTTGTVPNFAGTWNGIYKSNVVGPTVVTLIFQQLGSTVTGTYLSKNGAQGVMMGIVQSGGNLQAKAQQTTPTCPGEFDMNATVSGGTLSWTFMGTDCLGTEDGHGMATKSAMKSATKHGKSH